MTAAAAIFATSSATDVWSFAGEGDSVGAVVASVAGATAGAGAFGDSAGVDTEARSSGGTVAVIGHLKDGLFADYYAPPIHSWVGNLSRSSLPSIEVSS